MTSNKSGKALAELAEDICIQIARRDSWGTHLSNYQWANKGAEATFRHLGALETESRPLFKQIRRREPLSGNDLKRLTRFAQAIFEGGGVTSTNSKKAENGQIVRDVIESAIFWDATHKGVPMNSGWTKVAAISTEYLEELGEMPQVIFDSRVAASLLTRLDNTLLAQGQNPKLSPKHFLPEPIRSLGYVPGRGGTRKSGTRDYAFRWPNKYRRWDGQFAASRIVNEIKDVLNNNPGRFGPMPFSSFRDDRWTVRGVEMVLFRDGY